MQRFSELPKLLCGYLLPVACWAQACLQNW